MLWLKPSRTTSGRRSSLLIDAPGCLVFCSIFYSILCEHGPGRVRAMTQRVNVFDCSA